MNVISNYTNYLKSAYSNILKTLLGKNYKKEVIDDYVNSYIINRYYETFDKDVFYSQMSRKYENNRTYIDMLNTVFNYILYLDDAGEKVDINDFLSFDIIDSTLYFNENDSIISLYNYINNFLEKRVSFFENFDSKYFKLTFDKLNYNSYLVDIEHNIKITNLYSAFAKEKAFNTGTVAENKEMVLYHMLSKLILDERIENKENNKCYIVDFPNSLFAKTRKINKLLGIINNDLAKSVIDIKITYTDYLKNKTIIDDLIHVGYKFVVILDESFKVDKEHLDCLVIFDKIIIDEQYDNFEEINENRKMIVPTILCF